MNILITAGGTSELIDKRYKLYTKSYDNSSLASKIADQLLFRDKIADQIENLFYIYTPDATLVPVKSNKVKYIKVTDVMSFVDVLKIIYEENTIDYCIHLMDISIYYIDYRTDADSLYYDINKYENDSIKNIILAGHSRQNREEDYMYNDCIVVFKPSPNIEKLIKETSPNTILFKYCQTFDRSIGTANALSYYDNVYTIIDYLNRFQLMSNKLKSSDEFKTEYEISSYIAHFIYKDITL